MTSEDADQFKGHYLDVTERIKEMVRGINNLHETVHAEEEKLRELKNTQALQAGRLLNLYVRYPDDGVVIVGEYAVVQVWVESEDRSDGVKQLVFPCVPIYGPPPAGDQ